ncbi:MAG: PspA/IM30 family protein [Acidimicrobiales bacterium]
MLQYLKKRWKYLVAKLSGNFEETADPKVQLEQAITEAKDQHKRLRQQAANVIANQKQTELRLNRSLEELERVNGNARQAVTMADEAQRAGDADKATRYTNAAEQFANRLLSLEEEIESLKSLHFQASEAAEQAKEAVSQNADLLQKKLAEKQALLSQLDQAKMQESVNQAMATLSEAVGEDVPTFDEVRTKIEARYAKAKATAELTEGNVETQMLEIEKAARNVEAQSRLDSIKAELGLSAAPEPAALAEGADGEGPSGEA